MRAILLSTPTPIFIFSLARSGSTLVQSLLDGHPQLLVDVGELRFFRSFYPTARGLSSEKRRKLADRELLSYHFSEQSPYYQKFLSHIDIPALKATFTRLLTASPQREKDYLEAYLHALGLATDTFTDKTRHWVVKALNAEYAIETIYEWWPDAKFIHVVRDPRDVYTSHKSRGLKNSRAVTPIDRFAYLWARAVQAYLRNVQRRSPEQCTLLRYEDLITDLKGSLQSIFRFMEVDFHDVALTPTKGHGRVPWGGNAATGKKVFEVHKQATEKWRTYLSSREVLLLESMLQREMTAIQYSLSQKPADLKALPLLRFKNRLRRIKHTFQHRIR